MKNNTETKSNLEVLDVQFSKVDLSSTGISSVGKLFNKV
jgi:hypothetical protein